MPRKKSTETPKETKKTTTAKPTTTKTVKAPTKAKSVPKKDLETIKEIRRQTKVLQNTMKSNKFGEDWEEIGDTMWLKFKGDRSGKHFVVGATKDKKPVFTLYGLSPLSEYNTVIDSVSLEKDTDDKIVIKFSNKLGEYRHQFFS